MGPSAYSSHHTCAIVLSACMSCDSVGHTIVPNATSSCDLAHKNPEGKSFQCSGHTLVLHASISCDLGLDASMSCKFITQSSHVPVIWAHVGPTNSYLLSFYALLPIATYNQVCLLAQTSIHDVLSPITVSNLALEGFQYTVRQEHRLLCAFDVTKPYEKKLFTYQHSFACTNTDAMPCVRNNSPGLLFPCRFRSSRGNQFQLDVLASRKFLWSCY